MHPQFASNKTLIAKETCSNLNIHFFFIYTPMSLRHFTMMLKYLVQTKFPTVTNRFKNKKKPQKTPYIHVMSMFASLTTQSELGSIYCHSVIQTYHW